MLAEALAGLAKAAEVKDASHAGPLRRLGEPLGHLAVAAGVLAAGNDHRMDEVIRGFASCELFGQLVDVFEISLGDLEPGMIRPRPIAKLLGRSHDAADVVTGVEQSRHEPPADVTGGAGDENFADGVAGVIRVSRCHSTNRNAAELAGER
jgi:hypothetical protein